MDDLTIAIGTLDDYPVLETCLRSVYEEDSSNLRYRVWVVYNGSGDGRVVDRIRRTFPQVELTERVGPLGYCATYNIVLKQAESRYTLLLDNDTIVPKGALATMVAFMDAQPDVGIAGCKTLNRDGTFQKTFGLLPSLRTELLNVLMPDAFWADRLYKNPEAVQEVEWLNGSFLLVRSEVVKEVGILDEHYYTYVCESDWCYRIRQAGWRVVYVPDAQIIHIGGEHSLNNKYTATNYVNLVRHHANHHYFFRKHYSPLACLLLRPIMVSGLLLRIAYYALVYLSDTRARPVAAVRLKAFWESVKLSCSSHPYRLPLSLSPPPRTAAAEVAPGRP